MPNAATPRYLCTALALGLIAVWASENLFWSAPPTGLSALDLGLTAVAYAFLAAAALSAVIHSGIGGWKALFLGGALLGWLAEGVIVATTYDSFPLQLVWTPLAWHALISALAVLGLCRAGVHWPVRLQVLALVVLGVAGAFWAQFWPNERAGLPGFAGELGYLAGLGIVVPLANLALDRIGALSPPPRWVLLIAPLSLLALWLAQTVATLNPLRLSVPLLIGVTVWMMHRLADRPADSDRQALAGNGAGTALDFGRPAPAWRHWLFLIAPLITATLTALGWRWFPGLATNLPVALATGTLSLGLWLWMLAGALRNRPAPAA